MKESKSFQTKLPVFKRAFSASYIKTLCGGNSPVEALLAKIMIKDQLIMALFDSSVNLLSDTLYQQLGEPSQIRVCNKNIIAANNRKILVKWSTAIQVQLRKITSEMTVEFLVTKIEITLCLLGMEFLNNFDCNLNLRKNDFFAGQLGKHYNCPHHNEVIRICF